MSHAEAFRLNLLRHGAPATVLEYTAGKTCPCMTSRDANAPAYSVDWHRRNPTAEDCGGSGIIEETTVETAILTIPIDAMAVGSLIRESGFLSEVGKIDAGDFALYGAVKVSDGSLFSFEALSSKNIITLLGKQYTVKKTMLIPISSVVVSLALIKRTG